VSTAEALIRWLATLGVVFVAFAPLVVWMFRPLRMTGLAVLGPVATLGVVLPMWWFAAGLRLPYSTAGLWASVVLVGAVGWFMVLRRRSLPTTDWRMVVIVFGAELAVFAVGVWLRGFTPDLTGTEKPMDIAFLASSASTLTMPPADPWFAGEPINYYALGYIVWGAVARMAGVPATTAFNLVIPTLLAFTAIAAGGVAYDAVRASLGRRLAILAAATASFLLAFAGNLWAPAQLLRHGRAMIDAWWWDGAVGIGWRSSRIVCDGPREAGACLSPAVETINEFPFFSFLLGDLHPHLMALPVTIAVTGAALAIAMRSRVATRNSWEPVLSLVAFGVLAGSLYPLNSWDLPTSLGLLVIVLWVFGQRGKQWVVDTAILGVSAIIGWLPFWLRYDPPTGLALDDLPSWARSVPVLRTVASTIGLHVGERTSVIEFLTIFGVPFVLAVVFAATTPGTFRRLDIGRGTLVALVGLVVLVALGTGSLVGMVAVVMAFLGARVAFDAERAFGERFAGVLIAVAMVLVAGVEMFYLVDVFHSRLNTLFKVYYQVWTLLALAGGIGLAWIIARVTRPVGRVVIGLACGAAAAALLVYPVVASYQWTERFGAWRGLDGIAYGATVDPGEYAAVRWLQDHATPGDVILEAAGCSYQPVGQWPMNRASAYTGIPTVIGWAGHENQWRGGQPALRREIGPRADDVRAMFADPSGDLASSYGVTWLMVGSFERGDWQSSCASAGPYDGLDDPEYPGAGWTKVVDTPTAVLYQRIAP